MSKLIIPVLVLFLSAISAEGDIWELTDETFDSGVNKAPVVVVLFYANWCPDCKRFEPKYKKAAEILKSNKVPCELAEIDCASGGKQTCRKFSIPEYPTLKIFKKGKSAVNYAGTFETDDVVQFVENNVK